MTFVGRKKEIEQIKEALEGGKNVIVSGKYGMGRTSLIKQVAERMQNEWRFLFIDFSETPGRICKHLVTVLLPSRSYHKEKEFSKYRSDRFRILNLDLKDRRKHVLVLDNMAKLTPQKIDFIRYLTLGRRFRFVTIVESFLSKNDLLRLRVLLYPAELMNLSRLGKRDVYEFYKNLALQRGFQWSEGDINHLVSITGGYPLRMREIADRKALERN